MDSARPDKYLLLAEFSVRPVNYVPPRLIRCLLYGVFLFGGSETSAGRTIWQSFDGRQKRKFFIGARKQ